MRAPLRSSLKLLATVGIGALALWLTFRGVGREEALAALRQADWPVFVAGAALFLVLHLARCVRWTLLVRAVRPEFAWRSGLAIGSIGFLMINVLPFRLGELVRPWLLVEKDDVPFGAAMATILVERVADVLALGALIVGVLAFADLPASEVIVAGQRYDLVRAGRAIVLSTAVPAGGAVLILVALGDRGVALARRVASIGGAGLAERVGGFVATFVSAMRAVGEPRRAALLLLTTVAVWGINVTSMVVTAWGFPWGAAFGFWDGATLLSAVCAALVVPAPPGFAGVFELSVAVGLRFLGVQSAGAAVFGLLLHIAQFTVLAALGCWFLWTERIPLRHVLVMGRRRA